MKWKLIMLVSFLLIIIPIPIHATEVTIPKLVKESCDKYGEEYGICSELLQSICWTESRCTARATNGNCKGMCQINVGYQQDRMERLGIDDIYNADQCIHLCADILYEYFMENEDLYLTLMRYNCGSDKGKELFNQGIITYYAREVSGLSAELERRNGK